MSKKPTKLNHFAITNAAKIRLIILFFLLVSLGIWTGLTFSEPTSPQQAAAQVKLLEAIYQKGNYIEAGIWIAIALGFGVRIIRRSGTERYQALMAFLTFFFFGLSDIIEVQTGAWWRPWWLFVWKSLCVFSMAALLINYLRSRSDSQLY
ncbi:MAG: hypothetical protein RID09_11510 [Coleofasciculus sp. G1-WW12-02]|uniref:hypothetical protein n=1 Tax=Coleofasciculus sp. G1-WW12-02 TaxID=3068483 RepID=UPI0032F925EA